MKKIFALLIGLALLLPAVSLPVNAIVEIYTYGPTGSINNPYEVEQGDDYTIWARTHDANHVTLYEKLLPGAAWEKVSSQYTDNPSWTFDANVQEYRYYKLEAVQYANGATNIDKTDDIVISIVPKADEGGDDPEPLNEAPTAGIRSPASGSTFEVGEIITFNGANSDDSDGTVKLYKWSFGDKYVSSSSDETIKHSYRYAGTYTVRLQVRDNAGEWSTSDSITLIIHTKQDQEPQNVAPIADLEADHTSGYAPFEVEFDISGSYDSDGKIVGYVLEFGDGDDKSDYNANGIDLTKDIEHTYENIGVYTAKLTVMDDDGAADTTNIKITVNKKTSYDHGGGSPGEGGSPGTGGVPGGSPGTGGLPSGLIPEGAILPSQTHFTIELGEEFILPMDVINLGSYPGEFEIDLGRSGLGNVWVNPSEFDLDGKDSARSYLHINANSEGSYVLEIELLQDGEVVDTVKLYVTVEGASGYGTIFGLIALLIVSLAGVCGLAFLVYKENYKAKSELEKYY